MLSAIGAVLVIVLNSGNKPSTFVVPYDSLVKGVYDELGVMRNEILFDIWNRVHPGAYASTVVGKRPSDWVICVGEEG